MPDSRKYFLVKHGLGRTTFKGQMLVPINDRGEFERVRDYTLAHELDPGDIPFLGRERAVLDQ